MKKHICELCNTVFIGKSNLSRHLNKKRKCNVDTDFECKWCNKSFSTNSNLTRHETNTCLVKQQYDTLKQQIQETDATNNARVKELEEKYRLLEEKIGGMNQTTTIIACDGNNNTNTTNLINNNNTTNNTKNITINKYGCEDMSHITLKRITFVFDKCFRSVVECVKLKHFSPLAPQNRNVYISDLKSKHAYIFVGHQWDAVGRAMLLDDMYDDICDYIESKLKEFMTVLEPHIIMKIQRFLDEKEEEATATRIKEDLRLLLFNNNI